MTSSIRGSISGLKPSQTELSRAKLNESLLDRVSLKQPYKPQLRDLGYAGHAGYAALVPQVPCLGFESQQNFRHINYFPRLTLGNGALRVPGIEK